MKPSRWKTQGDHLDNRLEDFIRVSKSFADLNQMTSWINSVTLDREMPIKFLPIMWDKLRYKLQIAGKAGIYKAITFKFSHFMSQQSAYPQAGHLYRHCQAYLKKK